MQLTQSIRWTTTHARHVAARGALALAVLFGSAGCLDHPPADAAAVDAPHAVAAAPVPDTPTAREASFLPAEALDTLALIRRGGPFPHPQDGTTFFNREGHLPRQPRGHYREYTVQTPGLAHRGARRIVTGGQPPRSYYYTDDHYDSFRMFEPGR